MARTTSNPPEGKRSKTLLILTSIYGVLYAAFIVSGSYGMQGAEPTVVRLLFLLFLVGYVVVWVHEGLGGALFVAWWVGMWYLGLFVAHEDRGNGVVMGVPLVVLAILFIRAWYTRTHSGPSPS